MKIRKLIFWIHLVAGIGAGVIIALMSLTGAALAFEKDLLAWSERDLRQVHPPSPPVPRLPVQDLIARVREKHPAENPSAVTTFSDPTFAVLVSFGPANPYFVNPYTGEVGEPGTHRMRNFMQVMLRWHRWLGREGDGRDRGKAVTGASNLAFLGLAISGVYLWWPRHWTAQRLRAVSLPSMKGHGKARDWNWHNAFGFWAAPVLIVLTVTALPISYRWAGDLIYRLTGTPKPAAGTSGGPGASPSVTVPPRAPDSKPLDWETLLVKVGEQAPNWEQMTIRFGSPNAGRTGANARTNTPAGGESRGERPRAGVEPASFASPSTSPVTISVKEINGRPRFASWQFTLDPFTGTLLRQEKFADLDRARQVRSWTRFLHTGEALGLGGQAVAGIASAVAGLLVWTGFALAWRRFFGRKSKATLENREPAQVAP